jgi:predicted nucleotide-binding protein
MLIEQKEMKKEYNMGKEQASKTSSSPITVIPREEAIRRIGEQIERGRDIKNQRIFSMMDLENALERKTRWVEDNMKLFIRLSNHFLHGEEYNMNHSFDLNSAMTFSLKEQYFKDNVNEHISRLESFLERLKLTPENKGEERKERKPLEEPARQERPQENKSEGVQPRETLTREVKPKEEPLIEKTSIEKLIKKRVLKETVPKEKPQKEEPQKEEPQKEEPPKEVIDKLKLMKEEPPSPTVLNQSQQPVTNILLIHGRDETAKETILKFIEKLEHRAIILHEQSDRGGGIIEKFKQLSKIDFAIFLFTANDIAPSREEPREGQAHGIQNLLFEFGYILGKLGQERVCALYKEKMEIPPDYSGIVFLPMDSRGVWKLLVAKEMKQAGIEIDLNKAV